MVFISILVVISYISYFFEFNLFGINEYYKLIDYYLARLNGIFIFLVLVYYAAAKIIGRIYNTKLKRYDKRVNNLFFKIYLFPIPVILGFVIDNRELKDNRFVILDWIVKLNIGSLIYPHLKFLFSKEKKSL